MTNDPWRAGALALVLAIHPTTLSAQTVVHAATTPAADGRYEVVQSPLAAKWTFLLDRFAGAVDQLVRDADDNLTWDSMEIQDPASPSAQPRQRFQLFLSGLAARHSFLIDNLTGRTWVLVGGTRKRANGTIYDVSVWQAMK